MKIVINTENINQIGSYEEGSFSEIELGNLLDLIKFEERQGVLNVVLSKLQFEGIIKIQGLDIRLLAQHILHQQNTLADINVFLAVASCVDTASICESLKQAGLTIQYKGIGLCQYSITAKK